MSDSMSNIPIKPVFYLHGKDESGKDRQWDRFWTRKEAEKRLIELTSEMPGYSFSIVDSEWIVPDRALPTASQIQQLGELLHHAFITIRMMAYKNEPELIAEFSDILHNLPKEMYDPQCWDWNSLEYSLEKFAKRNPGKCFYDFAGILRCIRQGPAKAGAASRQP